MPSNATKKIAKRTVNPEGTKTNILSVATREFGTRGYDGARIDRIAAKTRTSKRMLYYYFKSKKGLYAAVLEASYRRMREAESNLNLAERKPREAIVALIESAIDYHFDNPVYVRLVMNENINQGRQIDQMEEALGMNVQIIERISRVLKRGQEAGLFRRGVDPVALHLLITALAFFPVSNQHTFSKIFDYDLSSANARRVRKREAVKAVLGYLRPD